MASSYICFREKELLPSIHEISLFNQVLIPEVIELSAIVQINLRLLMMYIQIYAVIQGSEEYCKHSDCL